MLKNKKALYILVPICILVWGLIGYSIYSGLSLDESDTFESNTVAPEMLIAETTIDSFSVSSGYRDPFMGRIISAQPKTNKSTTRTKPKREQINWNFIQFNGIISNPKSDKKLVLVKLNGKENFMKKGQEVEGVKLLQVYADSIQVEYKLAKRYIRKLGS